MDISAMSTSDLRRLQTRIGREVEKRTNAERRVLIRQFKKMAAEKGLTLEQLLSETSATAAKTAKAGKAGRAGRQLKTMSAKKPRAKQIYFNPDNPEQGWSGHGRRPKWILEWQAQGKSIELLRRDGGAASSSASTGTAPKPAPTPPSQAFTGGGWGSGS